MDLAVPSPSISQTTTVDWPKPDAYGIGVAATQLPRAQRRKRHSRNVITAYHLSKVTEIYTPADMVVSAVWSCPAFSAR